MSEFKVKLDTVKHTLPIEGADAIESLFLESTEYPFIVQKGVYQSGDTVLYFPLDAVLPEHIIEKLELNPSRLRQHTIVKTFKLKKFGVFSQGVVCKPELFLTSEQIKAGLEDYAELLGVVKYEEPLNSRNVRSKGSLPPEVFMYDIENAENQRALVELLKDQVVLITEKLEGSHFSITSYPDGTLKVCSRRQTIDVDYESWWSTIYHKYHWFSIFKKMASIVGNYHIFTVRGEIVGPGVQRNIYDLKELELRVFEIEIDSQPVGVDLTSYLYNICLKPFAVKSVPTVYEGPLSEYLLGRSLKEAANGPSELKLAQMREGIVIKPWVEQKHHGQRVFVKQRDPQYLDWWG